MIINNESTDKIKKFIVDNPDILLLDNVIINALNYASDEIIIFLLSLNTTAPPSIVPIDGVSRKNR